MKKTGSILLLLLFFAVNSLYSQPKTVDLSLKEALDQCKLNNFSLARGRLDIDKTKFNAFLKLNAFYPNLSLSFSAGKS